MPRNTRAGIEDGQIIATVRDRFDEPRNVVQRGSRIRIANTGTTLTLEMNREAAILIGKKIRQLRTDRGLGLEQLAIMCGITSGWPKNRMHEIEMCVRQQGVRIGTLYAIAAALKVEVSELMPSVADVMKMAKVAKGAQSVVVLSARGKVVNG